MKSDDNEVLAVRRECSAIVAACVRAGYPGLAWRYIHYATPLAEVEAELAQITAGRKPH
jgi:hypothetical protein